MAGQQSDGAGTVQFSGELTLDNAGDLRDTLAKALAHGRLEICFGEVKDVDLSFLQLLCSALRTASAASCGMTVAMESVPPVVSRMVRAAGMVSPLERGEDTFWASLAGERSYG